MTLFSFIVTIEQFYSFVIHINFLIHFEMILVYDVEQDYRTFFSIKKKSIVIALFIIECVLSLYICDFQPVIK